MHLICNVAVYLINNLYLQNRNGIYVLSKTQAEAFIFKKK